MTLAPPPPVPAVPVLPPQSSLDDAARWIKEQIDAACVVEYTDAWREHLGASVIGTPCERELAYAFRWIAAEKFDGRMLRLFQRGHREEQWMVSLLRMIGITVFDTDPKTNNQYRVSGHRGHFGGSLDGVAYLDPERFPGFPTYVLTEYKTFATSPFGTLLKQRVRRWRPKHYAQMCSYGVKMGIHLALYFGENKNDDDIYIEFVPLDHRLGMEWEKKAARIVDATALPAKLSLSPDHSDCKYCGASDVCHFNGPYMQNCRSCQNATPSDYGQWYCTHHKRILDPDTITKQWQCWQPFGKVE
jgi:hypothetical protein